MKSIRYIIPAFCLAAAGAVVAHSRLTAAHANVPLYIEAGTPAPEPLHGKKGATDAPASWTAKPANGTKGKCAVSGDEYTVSDKTQFSTFNGRLYGFCCADCKPDFDKNPVKFAQ
jgi:YHS domain-containing protein